MVVGKNVRVWVVTVALVVAAVVAVVAVFWTGGNPWYVGAGVVVVAYLSVVSWRSGGRFEFQARGSRPLAPDDPPEIRRALLSACERGGVPVPDPLVVEMDVPGAVVGYDDGEPVVAVDPRLLQVIGSSGLEAIFAHELGHLGIDLHTDAVRKYLPAVIGFGVFWVVLLAGRGPTIATAGSVVYVGLAVVDELPVANQPWTPRIRYVLSLGAEAVALAASRYANRQEELLADQYAADLVPAQRVTEALYRIAAIATGDNDEDVTGPVPWEADRGLLFSVFATHPSIERRASVLGCGLPEWVRPYQPHHDRSG